MTGAEREAVRGRLEQLASANGGRLTPEAVVADARSPESPLHDYFTWDVNQAAYGFWIEQARTLITSVRIEMRTDTTSVRSVAYVRDPQAAAGQQGYVAVTRLRSDRELARDALVSEFGRVGDALRRAREIAAALDAQGDVDELLERVVGLRQRFMEPAAKLQ
jgi:hypothetical protein